MPYEETLTLSNGDSNRNVLSGVLSTNRHDWHDWHDHNDRYHRSGQYDPTPKRHEDARLCERNALAYSRRIYCSWAGPIIPKTTWIESQRVVPHTFAVVTSAARRPNRS